MRLIDKAKGVFRRTPLGVRWLAAAGMVVLALAACNSSDPSGDVAMGAASSADAVKIAMVEDQAFDPTTLNLTAGEEVTIEVTNNDSRAHDFAIESLGLNTGTVEADEVVTATFTVPDEGVEFVCTFHPDMRGRIEVQR